MIGANMGISKMTKEHLACSLALDLPVIIVMTKIDIAPA
jgi:GTPase